MKRLVAFVFLYLSLFVFSQEVWVFVDALNVRACPSVKCYIKRVVHYGEVLQTSGRAVYTDSYDWVEIANGGWVAMQFVDVLPVEISGELPVDFDMNYHDRPLPPYYTPSDLVEIPKEWSVKEGLMLRKEAAQALENMLKDAEKAGFKIRVISAYRSWEYQRELYERAIERYGPDQQAVAKPGRSEHQLGLAVDLVRADMYCALEKCFSRTPEYRWLVNNCWKYGFIQPYVRHNILYVEEQWHFRYVGVEAAKSYMEEYKDYVGGR